MSRVSKWDFPAQYKSAPFANRAVATPVGVETLIDILCYQRFAGTQGEQDMIDKYLLTIPGNVQDEYGNIWVEVGDSPTTMFSSHTDTVEKRTATGRKKVTIDNQYLRVAGKKGGVLGADCGTGIWIMLNLIAAEVPGLYVFHREEEIGGGGSLFAAREHAHAVEGIQRCIAFDRKGTSHVITHQGGTRCCSEEFALALAAALNTTPEMCFEPNDTGSFTDSANYTHLIPECTNLSVGYYDQHTQDECQDITFATHLVDQLLKVDWDALPTVRDPEAEEEDDLQWNWMRHFDDTPRAAKSYYSHAQMVEAIGMYPAEVAEILISLGYRATDLVEELQFTYDCDVGNLK
jgi:hypothetical protein